MLIWLLGKSGAGKTFFAKKIIKYLEKKNIKCFHIDGDEFRKYISIDLKYDLKSRYINGLRVFKFCKYLISKKYTVVLSMQSAFRDMQKKNKKNFKKYIQINLTRTRSINKFKRNEKFILGKDIKFSPLKGYLNIQNKIKNTKKNFSLITKYLNKKFKI